jgi:hypothetical protein
MGLESANLIKDLNVANPAPSDNKAEGDDHLRLIKRVLKGQFPNLEAAVTKTAAQLNADYRVKGSRYETIVGNEPMWELHYPGKVAYAMYAQADSRLVFASTNGSGGWSSTLFDVGPGGDFRFNNAINAVNGISGAYFRVNANGASYYTMGINGRADRHLHRNADAMGFLGTDGNWNMFSHDNGDLWSRGNVSGFSDERVKRNWKALSDETLRNFANMTLVGTYENIETGARMAGVSAQQFRKVLPEGVTGDEDTLLGVAYGNAAMVLLHKLTQKVLELEEELRRMRA